MKTFWVSWYSGNYADEGCTKPPFKFWVSGQRDRVKYGLTAAQYDEYRAIEFEEAADLYLDEHSRDDCTLCATIVAVDEVAVWDIVRQHFPDYQQRFCEERGEDFDAAASGRFV